MLFPFVLLFPPLLSISAVLAGIAFGLAVAGGPGPCEAGGSEPIVLSRAHADSFQFKWDAFETALDAGANASVTFTESEVSSRAQVWLNDDDGVIDGPRICLHDGYAEISTGLDFPGFLDVKVKLRGTAQITDDLHITITDIDMGNVPDAFLEWDDEIDGSVTDEALEHTYDLTLREGEAHIEGTP
jgi:hypothetical protein